MFKSPSFDLVLNDDPWGFYFGGGYITADNTKARTGDFVAYVDRPKIYQMRELTTL